MVIGNGLLANTFREFQSDNNIILFASGISNSSETSTNSFKREKELLLTYKGSPQQLIYFSTIGIHDPDLSSSKYILHKQELELLIQEYFNSFLIFRLPIVVSDSLNPYTLTNFIYNKIKRDEPVPVYKNAIRYLIDIQDTKILVAEMIKSKRFQNEIIDLNFDNPISMEELVKIFKSVLNSEVTTQYLNRGSNYITNNTKFIEFINSMGFKLPMDYVRLLIIKYYLNRNPDFHDS